jgi:hypothetical protein
MTVVVVGSIECLWNKEGEGWAGLFCFDGDQWRVVGSKEGSKD